ncbi:adducin [Purpureocillium lavendulum]|uniref:Adducin n=1 Tax=Purpureocillium lavendulum TaxID=1247861 RepID=A0AB34FDQ9_9HYPO|nr:adducin [Purpureocillium lavendulum]
MDSLNSVNVQKRLKQSCLHEFSEEEVKLRVELAAAYRLFAYLGWVEAIYNHLTVEVTEPDGSKAYLINAFGLRFDEVTASSLLKIDGEGNVKHPGVIGDLLGVNRAGWIIHGGIHKSRGSSAKSVMHSHHQAFTGIAATKDGFLGDISQTSETLGDVAAHDFEGIVVDEGERARIAKDIGDCDTLLLRNHGVITMGKSIGAAWYRMYIAVRAAEIQLAAQSAAGAGGGILHPDPVTAAKTRDALKYFASGGDYGTMEFTAYMRLMDKVDPSYRI